MPRGRLMTRVVLPAAIVLLLILVPWSERIAPREVRLISGSRLPIRAGVDGLLAEVNVNEGDQVEAGAVLGMLRDDDIRMALQETTASLAMAEREAAAALTRGDETRARVAEIAVQELSAKLELLRDQLERTRLEAHLPGVVLTLRPEDRIGEWLSAGETFVLLGRTDRLEAEAWVAQRDIERVRPGQAMRLKVIAQPNYTFVGTVREIAPAADTTRAGEPTFVVRADLDNSRGLLRPGMEARAKIVGSRYPIGYLLLRPFVRWFQLKFWR